MNIDQNLIRERVKEIFRKGHLASLGTVDEGGVWVSDIAYVADDEFNIYWISVPTVRRSQAILGHNQVAGSITLSNISGEKNLGVQFAGVAEKLEGNDVRVMKIFYEKRGKPMPGNEDFLKGKSWYKVRPTMIELIDEENFGFKKQKLTL